MNGRTYIDYNAWLHRCGDNPNLLLLWMDIAEINTYIQDGKDALQSEWTINYSDQSGEINRLMEEVAVHRTYLNAICEEINDVDEAFANNVAKNPMKLLNSINLSKYSVAGQQDTSLPYNIQSFITIQQLDSTTRPDFHPTELDDLAERMDELIQTGSKEEILRYTQEITSKDFDTWTNKHTETLAKVWLYAYDANDIELLETLAYGLNSVSYEVSNIENFAGGVPYQEVTTYEYICSLQPKIDMIDAIMEKMDPEINGEAYYSLNRLKYLEIGTVMVAGGSEMDCQIGKHSADVAIVDGKVQIQLSLDAEGHERQSAMFTVYDMREVVTAEMEEALKGIGLSVEEVEEIRLSILNDVDVDFAKHFFDQDYTKAFALNPEGLSNRMANGLAEHLRILDDRGSNEPLENMINELLYANPRNCDALSWNYTSEYLHLITTKLNLISEQKVNEISIAVGLGCTDAELRQIALEGREYYNQYSLWKAVQELYDLTIDGEGKMMPWMHSIAYGHMHFEISDLDGGVGGSVNKEGAGGYSFNFVLKDVDGNAAEGKNYYNINIDYPNAREIGSDKIESVIKSLEKQQREIVVDSIIGFGKTAADKYLPGSKKIIEAFVAVCDGEEKDLLDCAADFPYEKYCDVYKELTGAQLTVEGAQTIVDGLFRYAELESEINLEENKYGVLNFGNYTKVTMTYYDVENPEDDGTIPDYPATNYIASQALSPECVYNMYRFDGNVEGEILKGIDLYLDEIYPLPMKPTEEEIETRTAKIISAKENIIKELNGRENTLNFLSVSGEYDDKMSAVNYINIIDGAVYDKDTGATAFSKWLNP